MPTAPPRWRKSSRSDGHDTCVELANTGDQVRDSKNPTGPVLRVDYAALVATARTGAFAPAWRTSSHSDDTNCVQVHRNLGKVKDSKHPAGEGSPQLAVGIVGFASLVAAIKAGEIG